MAEITLKQSADDTGLSRAYIGRLASLGIIRGRKIGPMWVVDSESLREYTAHWHKPGPKSKQKRQQEGASPTSAAHQQETVIDAEGAHIRIEALRPDGQRWLEAKATRDDMQATIYLRPYGTMASVYTFDKRYDRADSYAPGRMGRKQEQQGKALLALLEKHMRAALVAAGWHTEERAGNELWRYTGSEARKEQEQGAAHV